MDYIIHVTSSTRLGHLGLKEQERERGREGWRDGEGRWLREIRREEP